MTGVARLLPPSARRAQRGRRLVVERLDLHDLRPVLPVAVADEQQDRRAERPAVADAAEDLGAVLLDRLARAAAVAPLAAGQVDREVVLGQRRGRPGTPSIVTPSAGPCDSPAVRKRKAVTRPLAAAGSPVGSPSAERRPPARASASFACISSSGAGWPVHSVNAAAPWWSSISSPSAVVAPGRRGVAQQPRPGVDQVEHEQLVVEDLGRDRAHVAGQPDRRRVDEDLGLGELGLDDRLVPGHRPQLHVRGAPAEVLDQPLGAVEVAVEHDDPLEALADEAVDDGPGAAAGAEHDRLARHLLPADELVERDLEARHVGVVADEPLALARDRVDRAGRLRLLGQPVDHRHDPLLVRDRDVGAEEVVAAQLGDRVGERDRGAVPQLVARVDAELVEGGLLHRAGQRVGHRVADEDDALRHARTLSRSAKKPG